MASLVVTKQFGSDIDLLFESGSQDDEYAAAEALFLVEQLREHHDVLSDLCIPGHRYDFEPPFEIKPFVEAVRRGKNVFSVKFRYQDGSLVDQRVFVGYHAQRDTYYVLSIAHRSYCYDTGHEHFAELLDRYEQSGIPDY